MVEPHQATPQARRPLLAAALALPVGVALMVLAIRFFRAARGAFSDQQAAQRVIVVVVTLLAAALALGLLALAGTGLLAARRPAASEAEQPTAPRA